MTLLKEYRPSIFHRICSRVAQQSFLQISPYFLTVKSAEGATQIPYSEIGGSMSDLQDLLNAGEITLQLQDRLTDQVFCSVIKTGNKKINK